MSGGVAQNIKANKLIAELDGVSQVFIPPGPGDESISIGAAYLELVKQEEITEKNTPDVNENKFENNPKCLLVIKHRFHSAVARNDSLSFKILTKLFPKLPVLKYHSFETAIQQNLYLGILN